MLQKVWNIDSPRLTKYINTPFYSNLQFIYLFISRGQDSPCIFSSNFSRIALLTYQRIQVWSQLYYI